MTNQFFIKNGSLCFIIPFFTENSSVCKTLSKGLEKNLNLFSKDDTIKEVKGNFIKKIQKDSLFPNAEINYCPISCKNHKNIQYKKRVGRFLCDCSSNAIKFHDDGIQRKNFTQFYLDNFKITYKSSNVDNFSCSFEMAALLYLMNEENQKVAYLLLEIDMRKIQYGDNSCSLKGINSDPIIFIKHLFYKKKLEVQIEEIKEHTETQEKEKSLQEWVVNYMNKLCKALHVKDPIPEYIKYHAFKYSFIELKEICTPRGRLIELDNIDDFLSRYSQQIYGLLLSDEGWSNVPIETIKPKLQDYWTTRDYACTFFLQHNALAFNLKDSKSGQKQLELGQKWFAKYNDNKYAEYVSNHPCLTGIDTLTIFTFLDAIYKEINIDKYERRIREGMNNKTFWSVSTKIRKTRERIDRLQEILNNTSVGLEEMASMERCIYKQFGIIEQISRVKDLYKQLVEELNFEYDDKNNNKIAWLTLLTVIIGLLSPFLSVIIDKKWERVKLLLVEIYESLLIYGKEESLLLVVLCTCCILIWMKIRK